LIGLVAYTISRTSIFVIMAGYAQSLRGWPSLILG
jgi:hypothetical protein